MVQRLLTAKDGNNKDGNSKFVVMELFPHLGPLN